MVITDITTNDIAPMPSYERSILFSCLNCLFVIFTYKLKNEKAFNEQNIWHISNFIWNYQPPNGYIGLHEVSHLF